jgi:8-oxo-dGTP diphosphatase
MGAGTTRLPVIDVAAAIVQDRAGRILLAERKQGQLSAGFWELPGGKIEPGETPEQAAGRELAEEVGLRVGSLRPLASYAHSFPTRRINLRFFRAETWDGTASGREGQRIAWVDPAAPNVSPLLPSHERVLQQLALPRRVSLACGQTITCPNRLLRGIGQAADDGAKMIVLDPPKLSPDQRVAFTRRAQAVAAGGNARIVLQGSALEAQRAGAAGALSDAAALRRLSARPALRLWGAICHDADDTRHAAALGADFILLGPVLTGHGAIGWSALQALASQLPMPVFAFGGLPDDALGDALRAGAAGLAVTLKEAGHQKDFGGHA